MGHLDMSAFLDVQDQICELYAEFTGLTHWPIFFSDDIINYIFLLKTMVKILFKYQRFFSEDSNNIEVSIGSANSLAPERRQAFVCLKPMLSQSIDTGHQWVQKFIFQKKKFI